MKTTVFKKALVTLMIIAMVLPCIPVVAFAASTVTTRTYSAEDKAWYTNDTSASEFTIRTAGELAYFMELGTTTVTFVNKRVKLGADIVWNEGTATVNGFTPAASQQNKIYSWTPYAQGKTGSTEGFRGVFDGQGHTISGLYIDHTTDSVGVGFIGVGRDCTVKNVNFTNSYVAVTGGGNTKTFGIAIALGQYYGATTVTNVHTAGVVLASNAIYVDQNSAVGGIVGGAGYNTATLTISNCTSRGSVRGRNAVGGIVGEVMANTTTLTTKNLDMTDCINYADVAGAAEVGGLVGRLASAANFERCTSFGKVKASSVGTWSGSLVSLRLNNHDTDISAPTAWGSCAVVYFKDCFYVKGTNRSNSAGGYVSNDFPIYVNNTSCGHRIIISYSDGENWINDGGHTLFPTHANVSEKSAYAIAGELQKRFEAINAYSASLLVPAAGTAVVAIEGVQTAVGTTANTFKARFVSSVDLGTLNPSDVQEIGFQATILNDYARNGSDAVLKTKACTKVYKSIISNNGMDTLYASDFEGADYIATMVIENIPNAALQSLLVRSYYKTTAGETYYGGYAVCSFVNGKYAGSSVVSTTNSDSYEPDSINLAVNNQTTTYDLAGVLPASSSVTKVTADNTTYNGSTVNLSAGKNTFSVDYTVGGKSYNIIVNIVKREECRVIFNSNGGSYIAPRNVAQGTYINYDSSVTPTRANSTFKGWFTEDGTQFAMSNTPINNDIVLIAKWSDPTSATGPDYSDITYSTSSAALNINWQDYGNAFGTRPSYVLCTLMDTSTNVPYVVMVTETSASFVGTTPSGASISQGAGNWTVKITGLAASSEYTFTQNTLRDVPYSTIQSGTTVANTYTKHTPLLDETAELYSANGRLYDLDGNVVTLKGVVTVNVGTVYFNGNLSEASLKRLQSEGVNCLRITMQLKGSENSDIGFLYQADGTTPQTTTRKNELLAILKTAVDRATSMGFYCIIDWGMLAEDGDPNLNKGAAEWFFGHLGEYYANNPYVIYEVCNEPVVTNGTWHSTIKTYAESVIDVIRDAGSQGIVLVAPNQSATRLSDTTIVSNGKSDDPIDYPILKHNVAYSFHIYAYTYEYTNANGNHNLGYGWRLSEAINNGLTVVLTEFSPSIATKTAQSTGTNTYSLGEAAKYLNVFLENDVSYMFFRYTSNFSSGETSSQHLFEKGNNAYLDNGTWKWEHLSDCGKWIKLYAFDNDGFIKVTDFTPYTPG